MGHRLAPEAERDLEDIAFYIFLQSGNIEIAYKLIESVSQRFALLATYPHAGRAREELGSGIRSFSVGEYILLYRVEGDDVVIQRVVRGSRDIEELFRE